MASISWQIQGEEDFHSLKAAVRQAANNLAVLSAKLEKAAEGLRVEGTLSLSGVNEAEADKTRWHSAEVDPPVSEKLVIVCWEKRVTEGNKCVKKRVTGAGQYFGPGHWSVFDSSVRSVLYWQELPDPPAPERTASRPGA